MPLIFPWNDSSVDSGRGGDVNVKRPGKASIVSGSSLERALVVTKRDRSVKIIGASTALFRPWSTMTPAGRN